jgi:hypothetical protein
MAVTAVYASISHISRGDSKVALDAPVVFSNIGSTPAAFALSGGRYGILVQGATFGTITLQKLSPDNSTYITVQTAFSANGYAAVDLPYGTYKLTLA